jgi:hypothetical protein
LQGQQQEIQNRQNMQKDFEERLFSLEQKLVEGQNQMTFKIEDHDEQI